MRQKKTKQLHEYWMNLYKQIDKNEDLGSRWPYRSDVSPSECRHMLSDMFILDVDNGNATYRLAGTNLCQTFGMELKGKTLSSFFSGNEQAKVDNWTYRLGIDGYVLLICSIGETATGERINLETLMLPITQDGRRGNRVLGITSPAEQTGWLGGVPLVQQTIKSIRISEPWNDVAKPIIRPMMESRLSQTPSIVSPDETVRPFPQLDLAKTLSETPRIFEDLDVEAKRTVGHLRVIEGGRD